MKRIVPVLLSAALLAGCMADLRSYPWVEPSEAALPAKEELVVTIPSDADDILSGTIVLLDAKLQELSDGNVKLVTEQSPQMLEDYRNGEAGLYLLSSGQMEQLDDRLRFTQMPFLFTSSAKLFALLNSESSAVRRSRLTAERLQGEIIGVYYGGTTWMLSRSKFYDEVGFYSTVGVLSGMAGNGCFGVIGGEQMVEGSADEILAALAEEKVKYCELQLGTEVPAQTLKQTKYIEPTNHRYDGWWLVLKNPQSSISSNTIRLIREGFAYSIEQQNEQRYQLDEEQRRSLEEYYWIPVNDEEDYQGTRQRARKYYRENWDALGIPDDIWKDISGVIQ